MSEPIKIAVIDNEVQAQLISSVLEERSIPHLIKSYHDSAYDGLFQGQKGWGHIEAPAQFKDEILEIIKGIGGNQAAVES